MLHYSIHDGAFRLKVCLCSSSKTQLKTVLFDCRREDSGLLVYKEHLPVSQVAVGDTNRPGSEAKMTVGPLRCQGDSKSYIATTIYLMLQLFCNKQTTLSEFQVRPWRLNQEHSEQKSVSFCSLETKGWYDICICIYARHWALDSRSKSWFSLIVS